MDGMSRGLAEAKFAFFLFENMLNRLSGKIIDDGAEKNLIFWCDLFDGSPT